MVRLVFRPYTQVRRSICTSEALRTSTRVSSGFILLRHSSPSFGYQRIRSTSALLQAVKTGLCCSAYAVAQRIAYQFIAEPLLSLRLWVYHPMTRAYARLLGPCFKTGRRDDQLLHRGSTRALPHRGDQPKGQVACDRPVD